MGEQQVFEESRFVLLATGFDTDRQRQARAGKTAPRRLRQRSAAPAPGGRDDGQIELFGHAVAKIRRTDLGNGQAAAGGPPRRTEWCHGRYLFHMLRTIHKGWRLKIVYFSRHRVASVPRRRPRIRPAAAIRSSAERSQKSWPLCFRGRQCRVFDQSHEIGRGEARQGRFGKARFSLRKLAAVTSTLVKLARPPPEMRIFRPPFRCGPAPKPSNPIGRLPRHKQAGAPAPTITTSKLCMGCSVEFQR